MPRILLINPNASEATTAMMVGIAQAALPAHCWVEGRTAGTGVHMILNEAHMALAAQDVARCWAQAGTGWDGVLISAFGDPGIAQVRRSAQVPVVGICEASLRLAGRGGRRFGIATVTPDLAALLQQRVDEAGLSALYTGIRLSHGEPALLASQPQQLEAELAQAVQQCIAQDGAQAVVIGGGPLGQAAAALQDRWQVPVIAPIPAAAAALLQALQPRAAAGPG